MTVVGFVGNMTVQKQPRVFVEAAAQLARSTTRRWVFVMVGDDRGGELSHVRRLADQLGLDDNQLHIVGYQRPVEPWLAGFDVLVAPAVREGFGRAIVEALLVGTPVAAADSGGHREIIVDERLGALSPPEDTGRLVSAVLAPVTRDERVPETLMARLRAAHSPARHARAVEAIYDASLGTRQTAGGLPCSAG